MLKDRLVLPSSYAAVKVAGLYLLSDILHNTGAPVKHASTYRYTGAANLHCTSIFILREGTSHCTYDRLIGVPVVLLRDHYI
jgi:hypothetical protein